MDFIDAYIPPDKRGQQGLLEALRDLADHAPSNAVADTFRSAYGLVKIRVTLMDRTIES